MFNFRLVAFLTTITFVVIGGIFVSYLARGYRFDLQKGIKATGILVVTSSPDGAQIIVNGELESATNATISLAPETYDVEVKKEGYLPWKKRLTIKKEEVTKVDTILLPQTPSLSPVTFGGAVRPILSPDGSKVAFGVPLVDKTEPEKSGLFIMDLGNLPIGFSSEPRRITNINVENSTWYWSPDGRQVLILTPTGAYITTSSEFTPDNGLINIQGQKLDKILTNWALEEQKKQEAVLSSLPKELQDIFTRKAARLVFSPDQKKILYTGNSDFTLPESLIPSIPGSSTQKQERSVKKGATYIFDIKEDRNFLISDQLLQISFQPFMTPNKDKTGRLEIGNWKLTGPPLVAVWFPTSLNVLIAEKEKVIIMDYDGTNRIVVFSGPYEAPFVLPFPNANRLLILTRFGAGDGNLTNLYSLGLK